MFFSFESVVYYHGNYMMFRERRKWTEERSSREQVKKNQLAGHGGAPLEQALVMQYVENFGDKTVSAGQAYFRVRFSKVYNRVSTCNL